ncbi:transmembrane protein [Thalictrum thalictroides]|uniref:Transmembrane protein n=1 Tax=Thalictrum thalictroides TaxID=46969 RepID=A0A7J6W7P2_THATH|nr:transmembrane protein [Thalictrum thalictroides]
MLCGSVTFVIGFILMPWVLGLVMVLYFVGIVSNLSLLGKAILCPSVSSPPPPRAITPKEMSATPTTTSTTTTTTVSSSSSSSSSTRRRTNTATAAAQVSPAAFASLLLGISLALMLCGSVTFVIGFILMPWVLGLVMVLYFVGIVSNLSLLGKAILCPSVSSPPPPRAITPKEMSGEGFRCSILGVFPVVPF